MIRTETLLLRPFAPGDLADLHAYRAQEGVGKAAGWPHHTTLAQSREALEKFISMPGQRAVVFLPENRVIGHLNAAPDSEDGFPDVRELGCALNRNYQRRGVMSTLIPLVLDELFSAGMREVWACCFRENEGSRRLIGRCGFAFVQCGTFDCAAMGRVYDTYEYRWTREAWRTAHKGDRHELS